MGGLPRTNFQIVLRALENELGGKLIARSTRKLSLTDEGQRYYNESRNILAAVDAAEHSFQSGRETVAGPLRIGSSVSFGRLQIASRLTEFLQRYPQVQIDLQLSDQNLWSYEKDGQHHDIRIQGNAQSNNSEAIREMVLGGTGDFAVTGLAVQRRFEGGPSGRPVAGLPDITAADSRRVPGEPSPVRQGQRVCRFHDPGAGSSARASTNQIAAVRVFSHSSAAPSSSGLRRSRTSA
jgi:hypothetical protein